MSNQSSTEKYPISPIQCYKLKILGLIQISIFITSLVFNVFLLKKLITNEKLRKPINAFVIALTILNLIGTIGEAPVIISNNFSCRWVLKDFGCVISGFLMYSVGTISVYLMMFISILRYAVIYKPMYINKITYKICIAGIFLSVFFGLFWSVLPLIGWSYYSLEENKIVCSVEWKHKSFNVISYNISIFVFVFILPIVIIVYTSVKIFAIVRRCRENLNNPSEDLEITISVNMTIYIVIFIIAWTPYATISFVTAFFGSEQIHPIASIFSASFAKLSMVMSSGFFIFTYREIKQSLRINKWLLKWPDLKSTGSLI